MMKGTISYALAIWAVIGLPGCDMTIDEEARQIVQSRQRMLIQFTASEKWIVFPIPLDREVAVLAVIDRVTGHRMLISSGRTFLAFPQLSVDGKRLLVIRGNQSTGRGQLLSCIIDDWHCRILVDDALQIRWPVEVRKNMVLYAAAEPIGHGTRVHYDFYLVDPPLPPIRLSTFKFYNLNSLTISGNRIMFSSAASLSGNDVPFPKPTSSSLASASSDIWSLQADWKGKRLIIPKHQLERLYENEGYSTLPTMSEDGARVSFTHTRRTPTYRYDLVIAKIDGTIQKYVEATTSGFSRPAIVGSTVLANQLFEDRYETTLVDLKNNSVRQVLILHHTPSALSVLDRREIRIAE